MTNKLIYLDYQATTPTDPRVVEAMMPYLLEKYGNPHSVSHAVGWEAEEAVEEARKHLADLIKANPKDIIFTSGATESNNLALKGVLEFYSKQGKNHLIISEIEHKCILMSAYALEERGFKLTILPVDQTGRVRVEDVKNAITDKTALVSIMYVNNEIGTINPIDEIGKLCREKGVFFHTDAAQAVGKLEIDVDASNIDLMSISSHKFYGPKGIGALYVRRKPRVRILPQIHGGGQERGMRSGTIPTFLCVGLGKAAEIAKHEMKADWEKAKRLSDMLYSGVTSVLKEVHLNGSKDHRIPYNLNLSFAGVEGESLIMDFNKDIAISSGSACTSGSLEHSYVLAALGVGSELANSSIRFGIGKYTTEEEVKQAIECIVKGVNRLRDMSPIWEMMEEGIDLSKVEWSEH